MRKHPPLAPPPAKILVIALRHLGDVLLITPLVHSLHEAYSQAQIDVLVFSNTAAILEGNPDINRIITTPLRPTRADYRHLVSQLFRRYNLAVITQTGDRPFIYGFLAAPERVAVVPKKDQKGAWKRHLVQYWTEFDDENTHTVLQLLKLADLVGAARNYTLSPPQSADNQSTSVLSKNSHYAVIHTYPMWHYKRWTINGWVETAQFLQNSGCKVVLSGGPAPEEIDYVNQIHRQLSPEVLNLAGKTSISQLADLIGKAKLYIGPDTGITHLAAATGVPVIALYGPTNPVKWAPWPINYNSDENPFRKLGDQRVNNVYLIQGIADCVPCHQEGCDRNRQSRSACLENITPEAIKKTILQILHQEQRQQQQTTHAL